MLITEGDLQQAEGYFQKALDIVERLAPHSLEITSDLSSLGMVAQDKGDLQNADVGSALEQAIISLRDRRTRNRSNTSYCFQKNQL